MYALVIVNVVAALQSIDLPGHFYKLTEHDMLVVLIINQSIKMKQLYLEEGNPRLKDDTIHSYYLLYTVATKIKGMELV